MIWSNVSNECIYVGPFNKSLNVCSYCMRSYTEGQGTQDILSLKPDLSARIWTRVTLGIRGKHASLLPLRLFGGQYKIILKVCWIVIRLRLTSSKQKWSAIKASWTRWCGLPLTSWLVVLKARHALTPPHHVHYPTYLLGKTHALLWAIIQKGRPSVQMYGNFGLVLFQGGWEAWATSRSLAVPFVEAAFVNGDRS